MSTRSEKVLLFGAGGLGHPAASFLSAMQGATFTLLICDGDSVQRSNLNRQFLFSESDIGRLKAQVLAEQIDLPSEVHPYFPTAEQSEALIQSSDFVIDATDSIEHKFLCNDLCIRHRKPYAYAGAIGEQGAFLEVRPGSACLRCVFGDFTKGDFTREQESCQSAGIVGATCGVFGSLLANAVMRRHDPDWQQELVRLDPRRGILTASVSRDPQCRCANP